MKQHFNKMKKLIIQRLFTAKSKKQYLPELTCIISNIGKRDFNISTWINKNNHWLHLVQVQKDEVLISRINNQQVDNKVLMHYHVLFEYDEVTQRLNQIPVTPGAKMPFTTGTDVEIK